MSKQEIIDILRTALWDAGIDLEAKQEIDAWLDRQEEAQITSSP